MSRVGRKPIQIPAGVTLEYSGNILKAMGRLGELTVPVSSYVTVSINATTVSVTPINDSKESRMMWGTARNLIANLVNGADTGFTVELEIHGVGYRANVQDNTLVLALGFSHDVHFPIPCSITIKCPKPTEIVIHGADRQLVGQVAAKIRSYRPPEPYKGKGVQYKGSVILRKEGKKK